ncbi:anti-sigma factor family protein [Litoreibacter albidus]|uniref:anti-sigma factor family protein n=1 Tax=Litoreibacter albidus TaxID=670155 RepID=UPI00373582D2
MTERDLTARQRMQALMFKAPLMIDCETFDSFVVDYLDGHLPKPLRFRFETHLRFCPECKAFLKDYKRVIAVTQSQRETDTVAVPKKLVEAVLKSIPNET